MMILHNIKNSKKINLTQDIYQYFIDIITKIII